MLRRAFVAGLLLVIALPPIRADVTATFRWQNAHAAGGTGNAIRNSIAFDAAGNILVTDASGKAVRIFTPANAASGGAATMTVTGVSTGSNLPNAVAVNPVTGHFYANTTSTDGAMAVYAYDTALNTSSRLATVTPFTVASSAFKSLDQICFSPDGNLMYAAFSVTIGTTPYATPASIVRVAQRGVGDSWTDTGIVIAPPHNSLNAADPDPRNNQGACYGLAADASGNLWVASAADPVAWDGVNKYVPNAAYAVRPLRCYHREPDGTYLLTAEIPLSQKARGIALAADGTLYVAEGRPLDSGSASGSNAIQVFRGPLHVGTVDTSAVSLWNLQSAAISPDGYLTALGQAANGAGARTITQWEMSGIPAVLTAALQGTVTDATTGLPVAGAAVEVLNARAVTDAAGHYTLAAPVTGSGASAPAHVMSVAAPGYLSAARTPLRVDAADTEDISLVPATAAASGMDYFVETALGAVETRAGMRRVDAAEGDTTVVSVPPGQDNARKTGGGVSVASAMNGNSRADANLYFDVDSAFAGASTPVFVSVTWLDDVYNSDLSKGWRLYYNASGNPTKLAGPVSRTQSMAVRTTSFYLADASFTGAGASGSDFYVTESTSGNITVQGVAATRGMPLVADASPPGYQKATFNLGERIHSAPLLYNGVIWAGLNTSVACALDAANGQLVSSIGSNGRISLGSTPAGRPVVFRTPDGVSHICIATVLGAVYVLNAQTGAEEWHSPFLDGAQCTAAPVVYVDTSTGTAEPLVYVALTYTDPISGVATGRLARFRSGGVMDMSLDVGTAMTSSPALSAGMDQVMVGYTDGSDGHVLITDNPRLASGALAFTPRLDVTIPGQPVKSSPTLTGDGRTMLIGSSDGADGGLHAANAANGGILWSLPVGGVETTPWVDYEAYSNAAQADTAFVTTVDGMIHSINLNTRVERPGFPMRPAPGAVGGALMVLNRKLYVGSDIGMLVIDPTNPTDIRVFSPAYGSNGNPPLSTGAVAPGFNTGLSASGRTAGQSVIAMTGSDGGMYEMLVQ